MNDLSTISGIIDALINLNAKDYVSDFDDYYVNKFDKIPFAQSTDALAEVFETASARLSTIAQLKQE